jgi:hypothetical protein
MGHNPLAGQAAERSLQLALDSALGTLALPAEKGMPQVLEHGVAANGLHAPQ